MKQGSFTRTVTGLVTLFIYAVIGFLAWPGLPWLAYFMGILGAIRFVLLVRQLPRRTA